MYISKRNAPKIERFDIMKLKNFLVICSLVFFVWLFASFVDMNICNDPFSNSYQQFAEWNIFYLMAK